MIWACHGNVPRWVGDKVETHRKELLEADLLQSWVLEMASQLKSSKSCASSFCSEVREQPQKTTQILHMPILICTNNIMCEKSGFREFQCDFSH